jgi:D-aspartate ligase
VNINIFFEETGYMQRSKAIVLGSYVNALAVTRSLGRHGVYVVIISHEHLMGAYSKYVKEYYPVADPYKDENALYKLLIDNKLKWQGAIVIPTDDFQVDILSKHKTELSKYYIVATADQRIIEIIQNKKLSYELASKLNISVPKTFFPENLEQVPELARKVSYPCILKAYEGHKFKKDYPRKVIEVESPDRLYSEYNSIFRKHSLMIQEIIEGDDSNIIGYAAYYDLEGYPLAEFTRRKIRQYPRSYGNARVAQSIYNSEIITLSRTILKELDYKGSLVSTEFKYDDRDGKLKFIEINARSVMWYSLIEASGMNLPWIMYQDLVLGNKVRNSSQTTNIFWIHEQADISCLFRGDKGKASIKEYLSPYFSKKVFAVFTRDDIKPAFMEWCIGLRDLCRTLLRRCARFVRLK